MRMPASGRPGRRTNGELENMAWRGSIGNRGSEVKAAVIRLKPLYRILTLFRSC